MCGWQLLSPSFSQVEQEIETITEESRPESWPEAEVLLTPVCLKTDLPLDFSFTQPIFSFYVCLSLFLLKPFCNQFSVSLESKVFGACPLLLIQF